MAIYIRDNNGELQALEIPAYKGEAGLTPDIQIGQVTTVSEKESAVVTKRGSKENPIFDFSIPRGESGVYIGDFETAPENVNVIFDNSDEGVILESIAPEIEIGEVITVENGQSAEVTKRGTNRNPVFDFKIPKGADGVFNESLTRLSIEDSTLQLTTDKWQTVAIKDNTRILLPDVDDFTEIHLFFRTDSELTLTLPSAMWKNQPTIEANKVYEFIFTYVDEWIAGCIVYNE